jgi:hypothetical protein
MVRAEAPHLKQAVLVLILAYVMPASSVLRRVAAARDDLSVTSLKADGLVAVAPVLAKDLAPVLGTSWATGELSLSATLSVRLPGRCRLDLLVPDSTKTLSVAWSNGKRRAEGPELAAAAVAVDELCATLALRSATDGESRAALERHLGSLKVDTRQVSLARFSGTVAYVVGDRGARASSFWVYKERFLPARVSVADASGQWDVRFIDYTSQATGEWLPRVVEVYRDNELQLRMTILSADGRANLEGVKF